MLNVLSQKNAVRVRPLQIKLCRQRHLSLSLLVLSSKAGCVDYTIFNGGNRFDRLSRGCHSLLSDRYMLPARTEGCRSQRILLVILFGKKCRLCHLDSSISSPTSIFRLSSRRSHGRKLGYVTLLLTCPNLSRVNQALHLRFLLQIVGGNSDERKAGVLSHLFLASVQRDCFRKNMLRVFNLLGHQQRGRFNV